MLDEATVFRYEVLSDKEIQELFGWMIVASLGTYGHDKQVDHSKHRVFWEHYKFLSGFASRLRLKVHITHCPEGLRSLDFQKVVPSYLERRDIPSKWVPLFDTPRIDYYTIIRDSGYDRVQFLCGDVRAAHLVVALTGVRYYLHFLDIPVERWGFWKKHSQYKGW